MTSYFFKYFGITGKVNYGDFFDFQPVFRDVQTGQFISRETFMKRLETDPKSVAVDYIPRAKIELPEYPVRKGVFVKAKVFEQIKEEIRKHNQAVGVAKRRGINFDDAVKLIEEVDKKYQEGEIGSDEYAELVSG
jgi:hypothetical protein